MYLSICVADEGRLAQNCLLSGIYMYNTWMYMYVHVYMHMYMWRYYLMIFIVTYMCVCGLVGETQGRNPGNVPPLK